MEAGRVRPSKVVRYAERDCFPRRGRADDGGRVRPSERTGHRPSAQMCHAQGRTDVASRLRHSVESRSDVRPIAEDGDRDERRGTDKLRKTAAAGRSKGLALQKTPASVRDVVSSVCVCTNRLRHTVAADHERIRSSTRGVTQHAAVRLRRPASRCHLPGPIVSIGILGPSMAAAEGARYYQARLASESIRAASTQSMSSRAEGSSRRSQPEDRPVATSGRQKSALQAGRTKSQRRTRKKR
jgi:hypothetical protein